MASREPQPIRVRGARTHNLRGVDVEIPSGALVAITGPSGAGKSSLAFDTIYAEAQRRYLESLSNELRAHAARLPRPDVDAIDGLTPAIAIDQRSLPRSPRSTLGTVSEISDHLRLLYARVGVPHCPICGEVVRAETPQEIVDALVSSAAGSKVILLAPVARRAGGNQRELLDRLRRDGWVRAIADGVTIDLGEVEALDPKRWPAAVHDVDVVVDRLVVKEPRDAVRRRASDSVETALRVGDGRLRLQIESPDGAKATTWHSTRFACEKDDFVFPPIGPALFSFNAPEGACPTCQGLGVRAVPTERSVVPDPARTLREGALAAWGAPGSVAYAVELKRASDAIGFDPDVPFRDLEPEVRAAILHGAPSTSKKKKPWEGAIAWVEARLAEALDPHAHDEDRDARVEEGGLDDDALAALREDLTCDACGGTRLRREARAIEIGGRSIGEVGALPIEAARAHLATVVSVVPERMRPVAKPLVEGALARLDALVDVGLGYLALDRPTNALSAGEAERARIATQLAGGLRGVLYVLDEPSRGLHARDTARLVSMLERLRDVGSTVLVVEHDLGIVRAADHVIDVGPVAGAGGGLVVAEGRPDALSLDPRSVTGPWLSGAAALPRVKRRAPDPSRALRLSGASLHGLRSVDVEIPLGLLVCVTGPSGSGKTSLILESLVPALRAAIAAKGHAPVLPRHVRAIEGASALERVVAIDQAPLGRSPRSTPATATAIMPKLRELFAALPDAKARGWKPSRFSSNVKGGRCEACLGDGVVRIEMKFLPDVFVECSVCHGARYDRETLEVRWKGLSIADVLATSVDDAQRLFETIPAIRERLDAMRSVGLGYLPLGQPATTLSGGEAQRVKLARELARQGGERTLFVLDEPTAGLHPTDVAVLLDALVALRDQGSTIVVIEHDVAFASRADWVIDLGPGAGADGGEIVAVGTPEQIARATRSATAAPLAAQLACEHPHLRKKR